jgi:hypothetical protein
MNPQQIALLTFALIFGAALAGFVIQRLLPPHHLSEDSKGAVHLGAGLIGTLAALILGLLVSSSKGTYDQAGGLLNEMSASYEHADRLLANYGGEAEPIRALLRQSAEKMLRIIWPEETEQGKVAGLPERATTKMDLEDVYNRTSLLKPGNPNQEHLQTDAMRLMDDIIQKRWMLQEVVLGGGISFVLLVIPVLFIAFITLIYAVYAPRNTTVTFVLFCCAACIAIAVFLISELSSPLQGTLKVSSRPLHIALDQMGKDR